MSSRVKMAVPLALSIAVVAFAWSEFTLNFNLHWFTVADGVFGKFGLPQKFQLVLPATFVTWGLYHVLCADRVALRKTMIACTTGTVGAIVIMTLGPALAALPSSGASRWRSRSWAEAWFSSRPCRRVTTSPPPPRSCAPRRCCSGGSPPASTTTSRERRARTPSPRSASR